MRSKLLALALLTTAPWVATDCVRAPVEAARAAGRQLDDFTAGLTSDLTPALARQRFGAPSEETGSGLRIYIYRLADGRQLWLGFPGDAPIVYARVRAVDGSMVELPLR